MNGQTIINNFNLYVDDQADLSSAEELSLLNKWYRIVLENRPWNFLIREFTTTTTGADFVDLPTDFAYITNNDQTYDEERNTVAFINKNPYQIVPFQERRQWLDRDNIAWVNVAENRLYFSKAPLAGKAVSLDYVYVPDDLTLVTQPVFPPRFHSIVYHGMATDFNLIEQSEKGLSYRQENEQQFDRYLTDMAYWDTQFKYI